MSMWLMPASMTMFHDPVGILLRNIPKCRRPKDRKRAHMT